MRIDYEVPPGAVVDVAPVEVSGAGYARFPTPSASWGVVTHCIGPLPKPIRIRSINSARRRLKLLAATAALTLATGCSMLAPSPTTVQELKAQPSERRVVVVATMATNKCEQATAADYTATEVAMLKVPRLIREGKLPIADAQRVTDAARVVRAELAATCAKSKTDPDTAAHARARAAMATVLQGVQR